MCQRTDACVYLRLRADGVSCHVIRAARTAGLAQLDGVCGADLQEVDLRVIATRQQPRTADVPLLAACQELTPRALCGAALFNRVATGRNLT